VLALYARHSQRFCTLNTISLSNFSHKLCVMQAVTDEDIVKEKVHSRNDVIRVGFPGFQVPCFLLNLSGTHEHLIRRKQIRTSRCGCHRSFMNTVRILWRISIRLINSSYLRLCSNFVNAFTRVGLTEFVQSISKKHYESTNTAGHKAASLGHVKLAARMERS
jgi:hypothetical protein